jgi:enamine deaminase RidA (YjgF/YER057c/UK114 family)
MPREIVRVPGLPVPSQPYAPAVKAGPFVFTSGLMATNYQQGLAPEARPASGNPFYGPMAEKVEFRYAWKRLGQILEAADSSLERCAHFEVFVASYPGYVQDVAGPDEHYERWRATVDSLLATRDEVIERERPTSSTLPITRLPVRGPRALMTTIAVTKSADWARSSHEGPAEVPKPLGGYSPALRVGPWLFLAGKIPTDYRVGVPLEARKRPWQWYTNEIKIQARFILNNLKKTVESCGTGWDNVVRTNVYLRNMADIPALDEVWTEFFPNDPPARTITPVMGTGVREGPGVWSAGLEIDVVAIYPEGSFKKEVIHAPAVTAPIGHASQAIRAGNHVFVSGLTASNADGLLPGAAANPDLPYLSSGTRAQTRAILDDLSAICAAAGGSLDDLVFFERYFPDLRELELSSLVVREVFGEEPPATTEVEVASALPIPGATVMASGIAYVE